MNNPFSTGQYQGTTEGLNMFEHCSAEVTGSEIPISVTQVHLNLKTRERGSLLILLDFSPWHRLSLHPKGHGRADHMMKSVVLLLI